MNEVMKEVMKYRQGDVLIIPIPKSEERKTEKLRAIAREDGRVILAHGEVTGHAHAISDQGCFLYLDEHPGLDSEQAMGLLVSIARHGAGPEAPPMPDRVLEVKDKTVMLGHEEHDPIELKEGQYIIRHQREFDPDAERRVAD